MTATHAHDPSMGPALTEVIDAVTGRVTVSGELTSQGADLVRGTVEGLRRRGHSTVVLDLADVRVASAAGLDVLQDLGSSMAHSGNRLLVQHLPHQLGIHL